MATEQQNRQPGRGTRGGPANFELRPGQPYLGQTGPAGASFVGWVLVQVWQTPDGKDHAAVQIRSSDNKHLMAAAAAKLSEGWPE